VAVFFLVTVAVELRRFPVQAPLHRLVARTCLGGAALAVGACVLVPSAWTGWAVLVGAASGLAACLVPAPREKTLTQIRGVALIGPGVAAIGTGVRLLRNSNLLFVAAVISVGVALISYGAVVRRPTEKHALS
jgi:hypothetical protein